MEGSYCLVEILQWTDKYVSLAPWVTASVLFVAAGVALWQLWDNIRARKLQGYANVINWLQDENTRSARRMVFELGGKDKSKWSEKEKIAVGIACHSYATIGIMLKNKLIPKGMVHSWRKSIRRCWIIVEPYIKELREELPLHDHYEEFEWLANKKCKLNKRDQKEEEEWKGKNKAVQ